MARRQAFASAQKLRTSRGLSCELSATRANFDNPALILLEKKAMRRKGYAGIPKLAAGSWQLEAIRIVALQ
jgi:hypothetical protein